MPLSSVMVRSLALAALGLSAAPGSFAQSANVTAFNPYNGAGLPGAAVAPAPGNAVPQAVGPSGTPTGGLAFNPWIQSGPASTGWVGAQPGYGDRQRVRPAGRPARESSRHSLDPPGRRASTTQAMSAASGRVGTPSGAVARSRPLRQAPVTSPT